MALALRNPWGEDLFTMRDRMDQLFNGIFGETAGASTPTTSLALDIRQSDDAYTIEASVPGFKPEDVEVTLDQNVLTVRGEHRTENDEAKGDYIRRERRVASLHRQVVLPAEVRPDEITASFENGVLTVRVPRAERPQPRRIEVGGPKVVDAPAQG